jgi:hypothetical protein
MACHIVGYVVAVLSGLVALWWAVAWSLHFGHFDPVCRPPPDGTRLQATAICHPWYARLEDVAPNHSPDPTVLAVTPAADPPVAPASSRGSS